MSPEQPAPWYEKAVIYQIQVALFQDTRGNGWGDLPGVTRRLDHVKDVGADAIWLTPFYRTPFVDGGYDVVDHLDVSDRFGTLEDFRDLMSRARELDLEVIVDLVVQHTSVAHPWFRKACRDRDSEYRDYYIWADEPHETRVQPMFPTTEDSVWTWHDEAGQYYRHTFYSHEPDLNLANPTVREEIRRVMEFWLELGVAGFRVDAVPYLVVEAAEAEGRDDGFWILEELRETVRAHRPDGVLIAEADVDRDGYRDYFGDGNRFTMALNFWLNNHLFLALARGEAEPLVRALVEQPDPPAGCYYASWLRNHDELDLEQLTPAEREETMAVFAPHPQMRAFGRGIRRRLAPMLSDPRQRKLALFLLCALPGTPVLLYGDEIGMGDNLDLPDRAAVRTPMQWADEHNAGFSAADPLQTVQPVIGTGPFGYHDVNVADQRDDPDSMLSAIRRMFEVRREQGPLLTSEATPVDLGDPGVLALRYDDGGRSTLVAANLSPRRLEVVVPEEHRRGWQLLLADHPYDDEPGRETMRLHGYGYRWLRATGEEGTR